MGSTIIFFLFSSLSLSLALSRSLSAILSCFRLGTRFNLKNTTLDSIDLLLYFCWTKNGYFSPYPTVLPPILFYVCLINVMHLFDHLLWSIFQSVVSHIELLYTLKIGHVLVTTTYIKSIDFCNDISGQSCWSSIRDQNLQHETRRNMCANVKMWDSIQLTIWKIWESVYVYKTYFNQSV